MTDNLTQLAPVIQQAESVLIIVGKSPSFDQQLASSSLYLSLTKLQKRVSLLGVEKIVNPTIAGLDNLKTSIGHKNLVIGFDYVETAVHNVSYHIDDQANKFYLTIKPQSGHDPLNKDSVEIDFAGAEADVVILFGVSSLDGLEQLYLGYEELYKNSAVIAVSAVKPSYTSLHLNSSGFSCDSEAVYYMLKSIGSAIDTESATNLLAGIQYETNNFVDPKASADTFEAVAQLIRLGGQRKAGSFSISSGLNAGRQVVNKSEIQVKEVKHQDQKDSSQSTKQTKTNRSSQKNDTSLDSGNQDNKTTQKKKKMVPTIQQLRPSGLK